MKSGQIEFWIEVPITVYYTCQPEEQQTWDYPGHDAEIIIDCIDHPSKETISEIIGKYTYEINDACIEDAEGE